MATYEILDEYEAGSGRTGILLRVMFEPGQQFDQPLITAKTGTEREAQLQEYADQYEADWLALQQDIGNANQNPTTD